MRVQEPIEKVEGISLLKGRRMPVVRAQRAGVSGELEDFDKHFERQRSRSAAPSTPQPKIEELKNPSLAERMASLGIEEER